MVDEAVCSLEGEHAGQSFAADLVKQIRGRWEGANDDLAVAVCPPSDDSAPAMD